MSSLQIIGKCPYCDDLQLFPPKSGTERRFAYEDVLSAASRGCASCTILRNGIRAYTGRDEFKGVWILNWKIQGGAVHRQTHPLEVMVQDMAGEWLSLAFYTDDARLTRRWPLIPTTPHISSDSSSPVCLEQARVWLNHCVDQHADSCLSPSGALLPSRVIAVGNEAQNPFLYESFPGEIGVYATLSYCWGQTRTFTTVSSTISDRKQGFGPEELPQTCRDAVLVTRALGIRYVWIDSLCIIQDSKEDWEREAAKMCDVYSNSHITFAALDSKDSDTGLFVGRPGRETISLPIDLPDGEQTSLYIRRHYTLLRLSFFHADYDEDRPRATTSLKGVLETRAWTLQEITLSPRMLWFSSWELGFTCRKETACECDPKPQIMYQLMAPRGTFSLNLKPTQSQSPFCSSRQTDWHQTWQDFVEEYTKRNLSHQTDRLPAIAGLAKAIHSQIHGKYLAGMWDIDIEKHLLWANDWGQSVDALTGTFGMYISKPRNPFTVQDLAKMQPIARDYAPSWSWASVPDRISFISCFTAQKARSLFKVLQLDFEYTTSNEYGSGQGTLTIEAPTVPVAMENGCLTYYDAKPAEESRTTPHILSKRSTIFPDLRFRGEGDSGLKEFVFLFAGVYGKNDSAVGEDAYLGLLLERLEQQVYRRVGMVNLGLDSDGQEWKWEDWEDRCTTAVVRIV